MTKFSHSGVALPSLCVAVGLSLISPVGAQSPGSAKVATVSAAAAPLTVKRGGHGTLAITIAVSPGFHVNAHKPNDPDLIPTDFTGTKTPGVVWGTPRFPQPKALKTSYEKLPMLVYQGRATVLVPFTVAKTAKPGRVPLGGSLTYQGCNATSCYPPSSALIKASVSVK